MSVQDIGEATGDAVGKEPDIYEDLRRVGALKRDKMDGEPADNSLSRIPGAPASRDTVGAWLRGDRLPQKPGPLLTVLAAIRAEAEARGLLRQRVDSGTDETVADLLEPARWRRKWDAEPRRPAETSQDDAAHTMAPEPLAREELPRARRAVWEWSPRRLGVHPAISGSVEVTEDAEFVLPWFILRAHDAELRARLGSAVAADAEPVLVVVQGGSCVGKTRSAFEAVRAVVPDDFALLLPADAANLLEVLDADALGPRTVLWLDEAQQYLDGPAGETVAAKLLRRLDAVGPLVVLATLWPDHHRRLSTAPSEGQSDPHPLARKLLAQAHRIHVPATFVSELEAVRQAARQDRSLAAALQASDDGLAQVLAAGPDLVSHYEHPVGVHGAYGKALISVAMDAYRLRVDGPLPLEFLETAAPDYLSDVERAAAGPDWFDGALTHARTLIKQTSSPLQPVPRRSGMGAQPGVVRLADYLQEHGRRTRKLLCPPASFFHAAARHLPEPSDLLHLALECRFRARYRHAAELYRAAADSHITEALTALAELREHAGDREGAERTAREAADAGSTNALMKLAQWRGAYGDRAEAERLYRAAAHAGSAEALMVLVRLREHAGDREEAELLAGQVAKAGNAHALAELAWMRDKTGDRASADRLYGAAVTAGGTDVFINLACRRVRAGDVREAERLYRAAADAGSTEALVLLARQLERHGPPSASWYEAERLYRAAITAGRTDALVDLAGLRENAGDRDEAERLYRAAIAAGRTDALVSLARLREKVGDRTETERLHRVATHDPRLLESLVFLRDMDGDAEGAEELARQLANDDNPNALEEMASRRLALKSTGAERLYRAAADAGSNVAVRALVKLHAEAGSHEVAERLALQTAVGTEMYVLADLAQFFEKVGDRERAARLHQEAVDRGWTDSLDDLARLGEDAGDRQEAERLRRASADAGHYLFVVPLPPTSYGLNADGSPAEPWTWPEPGLSHL
ncbi:tetratricopeptide repeat protein [Streptomyces sp. NPDC060035]|uniref:tetratricopeptide repeat protein n=1 Tax=Streptomyces sp. NPDC060035 TaxID=3347044 RepID=UPI00367707B9